MYLYNYYVNCTDWPCTSLFNGEWVGTMCNGSAPSGAVKQLSSCSTVKDGFFLLQLLIRIAHLNASLSCVSTMFVYVFFVFLFSAVLYWPCSKVSKCSDTHIHLTTMSNCTQLGSMIITNHLLIRQVLVFILYFHITLTEFDIRNHHRAYTYLNEYRQVYSSYPHYFAHFRSHIY